MKRDLVCCLRLFVDCLPLPVRNSRFLFQLARIFFKLPSRLFDFRSEYASGCVIDLSPFYDPKSTFCIKRVSQATDVNSFHLRLIDYYFHLFKPKSLLDAGCGSGFLIKSLAVSAPETFFIGIDYQTPIETSEVKIQYKSGEILDELKKLPDHSVEFVICAHVVEHLSYPAEVVRHLRRISSKCLVIICPLEKEFKWGMNYHVNFFPDKKSFASFLSSAFKSNQNPLLAGVMHERLGDIMYVESKASPPDKSTTSCY